MKISELACPPVYGLAAHLPHLDLPLAATSVPLPWVNLPPHTTTAITGTAAEEMKEECRGHPVLLVLPKGPLYAPTVLELGEESPKQSFASRQLTHAFHARLTSI